MNFINQMVMRFDSVSANESFARSAVAGFCVQLNPTLDEVTDIKTAVSEAVTNCVVHAYPNKVGTIEVWVGLTKNTVHIAVRDDGVGIKDFDKAREPFFSTKRTEERSGMGFTVMESFMDTLDLNKRESGGVEVLMTKKLKGEKVALGGLNGVL